MLASRIQKNTVMVLPERRESWPKEHGTAVLTARRLMQIDRSSLVAGKQSVSLL
jgi:hypothetical protein